MDRKLAKELLPLVNTHNDLLVKYAHDRIATLHKYLENTKNIEDVYKIQGKIAELRSFETLRDYVIQTAKGE